MDKEPNTNEETTSAEPSKLMDRPSDFRFHAAYLIYSDAWDKASSPEIKLKLNEIMDALSAGNMDYETFYREIGPYRVELNPERFSGGRTYIETQRKRDWRRREERAHRNKRHGR